MLTSRRLVLAHFWLAFVVFGIALVLGAWQIVAHGMTVQEMDAAVAWYAAAPDR